MFIKTFAILLGIALIILAIGAVIAWVIRARAKAEVITMNAQLKNRIESDLLTRLDEVRPGRFGRRDQQDTNKPR